ncbi:MAG: NADPH-dependent 7-cyano-7-deazaguanine reductase QueF [Rhodospirillaceae bacterium]|nr:NADPH-dependent 7-cyano-7-deazaguanine reductase QueF [Rhodospirillaceae bacterium]
MGTGADTIPSGQPAEYSPDLLRSIPRAEGRSRLGIAGALPFAGEDIWNAYELSWLDADGKPMVATGEFRIPANSPNIIESKSLKLYLNSLNGARYESPDTVRSTIATDLGGVCGAEAQVRLHSSTSAGVPAQGEPVGHCIDTEALEMPAYDLDSGLLHESVDSRSPISETLHSNLLKTNCPVTGQPDWATVMIRYRGPRIRRQALLAYLVSYRNHAEFHEQCVERMFVDIERYCQPAALSVYARYLRRGGLDINPFRSNFETPPPNVRLLRQ